MSKRNKTGGASAKRPVPISPSNEGRASQPPRHQTPTKKMKRAEEDELTFTNIGDRNMTPERAPSDDEDVPLSILHGETRTGSRIRTPSAKARYMNQNVSDRHESRKDKEAATDAVEAETGSDTDSTGKGSGDDYSDGVDGRIKVPHSPERAYDDLSMDSRSERFPSNDPDRRTPYDNEEPEGRGRSEDDHRGSRRDADRRPRRHEEDNRRSRNRSGQRGHREGGGDSQHMRPRNDTSTAERTHRGDNRRASREHRATGAHVRDGGAGADRNSASHSERNDDYRRDDSHIGAKERRNRHPSTQKPRDRDGRRSAGGVANAGKAKDGMFSTADEARKEKSRFFSDHQSSREASRASTQAHENRTRDPSPVRSARGNSPERRRDGAGDGKRAGRRDASARVKESNRHEKPSTKDNRAAGPVSRSGIHSPEWDTISEPSAIFPMDVDARDAAVGEPDGSTAGGNSTAGNEADGAVHGNGEDQPPNTGRKEFQLDDYDDSALPELGFCEMRASFTNNNQSYGTPYFLDLALLAEDLQEEEMHMIESAHLFKQSVPYANLAKMEPGAFDLDAPYYRLLWNSNWVLGTEPSMVSQKARNVVGIQIGIVRRPNLKQAVNLSVTKTYLVRRLGILPTEMSLKRMVRLMATKLGCSVLKLSIDEGCIVNYSVKGGSAGTPAKSRYTRAAVNKSTDPTPKEKADIQAGFYPSVLEFTANVKVYDARNTGFRFDKEHLDKLHELPEFTTFTEDSELNNRCLVAVGYTLNAYGIPREPVGEDAKESPTMSSNIQFAILLAILPFEI
ncbi:hypothetical protein CVT24_004170 [Panaeolus cyanescens]|uniref:Uncharacterized protein n=1 Tax=Panaeolus cyanescens TaxID=181874 RepID=A0A409YX93_9AGAR|nr:hypothetical protein CVT24_004170 [Panaeolus cyanescens]